MYIYKKWKLVVLLTLIQLCKSYFIVINGITVGILVFRYTE